MIRHPFPEILHNPILLRPDINAVRDDLVDLRPAFAAGVLEVVIDVLEGLIDLGEEIGLDEVVEVDVGVFSVPAA